MSVEALREFVGQRVTKLLDHPSLSDDMTILDAKCSFDDGVPYLNVGLYMPPPSLFCSATGRFWDDDPEEPEPGNVVPLRLLSRSGGDAS